MTPRSTRWSIAILLLAAGASFWAARWLGRDRQAPPALPPARSDYALETFDLLVMNSQGLPSFRIEAPYLEKSQIDESLSVIRPRMWLFEAGAERWHVRAEHAWIRADGEEIVLSGAVELDENPAAGLSVRTSRLRLYPETRLARSEVPVQLDQQGMRMDGIGLDADLKARRFALLSQVRGQYDPK